MRISVAIPTRNRPEGVRRVLNSLAAQSRPADEILIVDSTPDERTQAVVEEARATYNSIRYVREERGLNRQRNRAVRETSAEVVVFLDDDVELSSEFIAVVESAFLGNLDVAGIGGYIMNQWGKPRERWWKLRKWLGLLPGEYKEGRLLPYGICLPLSTLEPFHGLQATDWLPGCAMAWRLNVFKEQLFSEFFDGRRAEGYGVGDELEFGVRVSRTRRLAICGDALVKHLQIGGGRAGAFRLGYDYVTNFLFLLHVTLQEASLVRHYQQLWYWLVDALLGLTVGTLLGYGRTNIPHALGLLYGVAAHILPFGPQKSGERSAAARAAPKSGFGSPAIIERRPGRD
jgi:glycosyltransferase involved in cell wall biosynthesis